MKIEVGNRFDRWIVIVRAPYGSNHQAKWLCRCDCGTEKVVFQNSLVRGLSRSCGCLHKEMTIQRSTIHGHTTHQGASPEYHAWHHMIQRCENKNNKQYRNYGGRKIAVYAPWHNFVNFLSYLQSTIGLRPSLQRSIDRINVNGNYEPENIRWATAKQQALNKRATIKIDGIPLIELAKQHGLEYETVRLRYRQHGSSYANLFKPSRRKAAS